MLGNRCLSPPLLLYFITKEYKVEYQRSHKVCIIQGDGVFRLRNVNIVGLYYLFNCDTCFGHSTIFKYTYFPRTYSIDNGSAVFFRILVIIVNSWLH
jgi:hypothetical protein